LERASIGPYLVLERLGAGGMGEVYLALDTRLNRKVALKYLSDHSLDAPHARDRLLREARAAAQITHPNIAAIYDILDAESPPCIVMEYAPGETLARLASRGPVACNRVLKVGVQLAAALAHAHAAGVIHRDLKPANAVLTDDGTVKVLDFGLARIHDFEQEIADADTPTTEAIHSHYGKLAGTPAYMAPEQLAGRPASALSDVYGLGVTLYELLTGRRPFESSSAPDLVYELLSKPTPLASQVIPSVPSAVDAIVARAMARDLDERYQSAAQMADDLRQAARDLSGESDRVSSRGTVSGSFTPVEVPVPLRRWILPVAASLMAAAALIASGYALWGRGATAVPRRPQSVAVLPFANSTGDPDASSLAVGFSESIAAALEGLSSVTAVRKPEPGMAQFLPPSTNFAKIAAQLGVTMIVNGSVSRQGDTNRFLVRVQRVDGRVVFEQVYPGTLADVARLQEQAVADVVAALNVALTPEDREHLRRSPACRADAYGEYATGRALLERADVPGTAARAEGVFARAVQKDPRCAPAYAGLSDAYWAEYGETRIASLVPLATKAVEEAARLDPQSPTIQTSLAAVYVSTGRTSQAEAKIREVIARRPHDDAPHRVLADALIAQGRTEEAIAALMNAIDLRPANVLNHIALGEALYNANRFAEATAVYARILEIQPDNVWAITNLGASYQNLAQPKKALEVYARAKQPDATILGNVGNIYYEDGRFADAARAFEEALKLDPRSDVKHRNLGDAYLRLGSRGQATEEYRQALALTREQLKVNRKSATLARYAVYAAKLGLGEEAVQYAEEAFKLSPDDGNVLYKRAVVHALLGQTHAAVNWLDRALQKGYSPSRAASDDDLGAIRALPQVAAMLREEAREKR